MRPAGGALRRRAAAEQTLPQGQTEFAPVQLSSVRGQHVHIEQPPQLIRLLDLAGQLFHFPGGAVYRKKGLVPGESPDLLKVQDGKALAVHLHPQPLQPLQVPLLNQLRVLHRARDVHGEGNQGTLALFQQLPLAACPGLPGVQHIAQLYFSQIHGAPLNGGSAYRCPGWRG